MDNKNCAGCHKMIFKKLLIISASLALLAFAWSKIDNIRETVSSRTMSFGADAKISVKPDTAEVSFSVLTQKPDAKSAQTENNKIIDGINKYLLANGISEADIKTTNYSLNPTYDYNWCNTGESFVSCTPKITGYEINQSVSFESKDFAKMADLVGELSGKGATNISNLNFKIEDQDDYRKEARSKAYAKAVAKAKQVAEELNLKLGKVVTVWESYDQPYAPMAANYFMDAKATAEAAEPAPIQPGSQDVYVNVSVTFEIK